MRRLFFFLLLTGLVTYATMPDLEARTRRHRRSHHSGRRGRGGRRGIRKDSPVVLSIKSPKDMFTQRLRDIDKSIQESFSSQDTPQAPKK